MDFTTILSAMVKLFLILAVGYGCAKGKVFPEGTQEVLTRLVLYVTTPCTILASVLTSDALPTGRTMALLFGFSCLSYVLLVPLALATPRLLRVPRGQRGAWSAMLIFSNSGFIGYPVVQTIFGSHAVFYAAVFNIPFYFFLYTIGVVLLAKDGAARGNGGGKLKLKLSMFLSPCLVASFLALIFAAARIRLPGVLTGTIEMLGNITTPAALLVIGIFISKMPLRAMLGTPKLYALTAVRLLVLPAALYLVFGLFIHDPLVLGVGMVITAMPSATIVAMLSLEYGADTDLVTQGTFLTTLFSMVTIPILVTILM